jgi:peroxiredoxin
MQHPPVRRSSRRVAVWICLVLAICAAAWVSTMRLGGGPSVLPAAGSLSAVGGTGVGPGIGQSAPDFVGADAQTALLSGLDGKPIRLADFAGKPLWIVFWATWCAPCEQEAVDIRSAYDGHRAQGLTVLAIDVQEPAVAAQAFALRHQLDYAIGLDSGAAVKALYGGWGLPSHFFVGADGVIKDRYLGQMTAELMEQHLLAILPPS